MELHHKVWGKEIWFENSPLYCLKKLIIEYHCRCSIHYHKIKDETFLCTKGLVLLEFDGKARILKPDDHQRIISGTPHRFTGLKKENCLVECSTEHFEKDSYRETASERVTFDEIARILNRYNLMDRYLERI